MGFDRRLISVIVVVFSLLYYWGLSGAYDSVGSNLFVFSPLGICGKIEFFFFGGELIVNL